MNRDWNVSTAAVFVPKCVYEYASRWHFSASRKFLQRLATTQNARTNHNRQGGQPPHSDKKNAIRNRLLNATTLPRWTQYSAFIMPFPYCHNHLFLLFSVSGRSSCHKLICMLTINCFLLNKFNVIVGEIFECGSAFSIVD